MRLERVSNRRLGAVEMADFVYRLSHRAYRTPQLRQRTRLLGRAGGLSVDRRWRGDVDAYFSSLVGETCKLERRAIQLLDVDIEEGLRAAEGEAVPELQKARIRLLGRLLLSGTLPEDAAFDSVAFARDGSKKFPVLRPILQRPGREGLDFTLDELAGLLLEPSGQAGGSPAGVLARLGSSASGSPGMAKRSPAGDVEGRGARSLSHGRPGRGPPGVHPIILAGGGVGARFGLVWALNRVR